MGRCMQQVKKHCFRPNGIVLQPVSCVYTIEEIPHFIFSTHGKLVEENTMHLSPESFNRGDLRFCGGSGPDLTDTRP